MILAINKFKAINILKKKTSLVVRKDKKKKKFSCNLENCLIHVGHQLLKFPYAITYSSPSNLNQKRVREEVRKI